MEKKKIYKWYKSFFIDKKTEKEIEPFYIVHKSDTLKNAKIVAKNYYESYISNKKIASDTKNKLCKNFKVIVKKTKKI